MGKGINVKQLLKAHKLTKDKQFMSSIKQGVRAGKKAHMIRILTVHVCHRYQLLLEKMLELEVINFNFGEGDEPIETELKELKKLIYDYGLKKEVNEVKKKKNV